MLNFEHFHHLLDYRLVELTPEEENFAKELIFGYALERVDEVNRKFYLEYHAYLYKNQEDLLKDAQCLHATFKKEPNLKIFMEWLFESKVYLYKELYNKGFPNFYMLISTNSFNIY